MNYFYWLTNIFQKPVRVPSRFSCRVWHAGKRNQKTLKSEKLKIEAILICIYKIVFTIFACLCTRPNMFNICSHPHDHYSRHYSFRLTSLDKNVIWRHLTSCLYCDQSRDLTLCSRPILCYSHFDWPTNGRNLAYIISNFRLKFVLLQPVQSRCQIKLNFFSVTSQQKNINFGAVHSSSSR